MTLFVAAFVGMAFAVTVVASDMVCPKSKAFIHAGCKTTGTAPAPCADLHREIVARVNGQYGVWSDPHNNGTYAIQSDTGAQLDLSRRTGDNKYTDLLTFVFDNATTTSCTFYACSQSQVTSVEDFSTNYCNLRNLYCGSADGCKFVTKDIATKETEVDPSMGAGHQASACLK